MLIADLQIHSRYARACSKDITIANLEKYARMKGLHLLGTGDFQHPLWRKEIDQELKEDEKGILWTKTGFPFLWQTEVSLMYAQDGRRAVHHLIFSPNRQVSDQITAYLGSKGRLDYDGRPIFGITSPQLVEDLKSISDDIEIIPAHCLLPEEKVICNPEVKCIEKVNVGDKVLTHLGRYQKVTRQFIRTYQGKAYRVQPYYFREGIRVTSEHPFLGIKSVKNCSYVGGLCKPNSAAKGKHICKEQHYKDYKPQWISAEHLEVNDILLYPRHKETKDIAFLKLSNVLKGKKFMVKGDFIFPLKGRQDKKIKNNVEISSDFCRLMGYYLAEGSISKKGNCVNFSFNQKEEDYINDVIQLMEKCFGISLGKKRLHNGCELLFYSQILVDFFAHLFYEKNKLYRAFSKKLPEWMLYLHPVKQVELFRGWWRGDTGVTASEILAQQMKLICLRLGIVPSLYKKSKEDHNKTERFIMGRRILASHDFFVLQSLSFFEDSFFLLKDPLFGKFKTKLERKHGWIDENYVYLPIKEIEIFDYSGSVYNLEVEEDNSYVTPAAAVHNCMTPWFGLFGSKSGFNSLKECFQDQVGKVHAIESGMSADPSMLWRLMEKATIVSFSDAHSYWPWRMGREATMFNLNADDFSYQDIIKDIRNNAIMGTIETDPAYGKYHWDGHRNCNFSCSPGKTKELAGICPVCGKEMTIGVDYRIEQLAKMPAGYFPSDRRKFYKVLPLHELLAFHLQSTLASKKTWQLHNQLMEKFGNEFAVLIEKEKLEIVQGGFDEKLAELIINNRIGNLKIKPGYDGEYGVIQSQEMQRKLV